MNKEEVQYSPPTYHGLPPNVERQTNSKSSERCTFKAVIQDEKQAFTFGASCKIFVPVDFSEPLPKIEELTPNVNPAMDVGQTAALEKSILPVTLI